MAVRDRTIVAEPIQPLVRRHYTLAELLEGAEHLPAVYARALDASMANWLTARCATGTFSILLTSEAVNVHSVVVAVIFSTAAQSAGAAGLTVPAHRDHVTSVAVCTHLRSFDLRARLSVGNASPAGRISDDVVDEIVARVASLIDPVP